MEGVIPTVAGSASLKGQALFLTLTNSHTSESVAVCVDLLGGAQVSQTSGQVLSGEIHALNTFDAPEQVIPKVLDVACQSSQLTLTLPAASVAAIQVHLVNVVGLPA